MFNRSIFASQIRRDLVLSDADLRMASRTRLLFNQLTSWSKMKTNFHRSTIARHGKVRLLFGWFTALVLLASCSTGVLHANGTPQLISPAPGSQLNGSTVTFKWSANGANVTQWYLRVGTTRKSGDIAAIRVPNRNVQQYQVGSLPTDGQSKLFVEFSHMIGGAWIRSYHQFTASSNAQGSPEPAQAESDNTNTVDRDEPQKEADPAPAAQPANVPANQSADNQYGPVASGNSCPGVPSTFRNTTYVTTAKQMRDAVAAAGPGDAVVVRNGSYNWSSQVPLSSQYKRGADRPLVLDGSGSASAPVYILPESIGGVKFTRSGVDWVLAGQHMVVAGFHFTTHGPLYVVNSDNRIACNRFERTSSADVRIDSNNSDRTEIDNNQFIDASQNAIVAWRCNPNHPTCLKNSKGTHVHHNTFRNGAYRGTHLAALVLGVGFSPIDGARNYNSDGENIDTVIENNLFDNWNGEGGLITIKSSRNIIRNNCVTNSPASSFVIRGGNDNLVTGNWFENAGGGIRISGRRNTVVFNYNGRKSSNVFGFRLHTGESYPQSYRPEAGYPNLFAYIDASNNVLSHNVMSGVEYLIDAHDPTGRVRQDLPTGNQISGNHIYSDRYRGSNEAGGYHNSSKHYGESAFRRANNWGSNSILGFELPASSCGNPSLFEGPGGRSATHRGSSNLLGGAQTIRAPSWW